MDHPRPWLRYVDAGDLDGSSLELDGLSVESIAGEKLGEVDGFIIDVSSARPYYVVVDGGGWFKSKFFLMPVGHIGLDATSGKLVADIERERVKRYPGFDRDEFETLSDAELNRLDDQMVDACCPGDDAVKADRRFGERAHHKSPSWWEASFYQADRADIAAKEITTPRHSL